MYANVNAGHRHDRVSRRITASVEAHWQHSAKNTISDSATGIVNNGRSVFVRSCTACHKVGNGEGQEYGPNLAEVGKRLTRFKIVESIIDPNADVDPKYQSTKVVTLDGKTVTGLVVSETKKEVVIFDGKEKRTIAVDDIETRTVLKQSSMPEGQAGAMAPSEFLDLVEYLASLK